MTRWFEACSPYAGASVHARCRTCPWASESQLAATAEAPSNLPTPMNVRNAASPGGSEVCHDAGADQRMHLDGQHQRNGGLAGHQDRHGSLRRLLAPAHGGRGTRCSCIDCGPAADTCPSRRRSRSRSTRARWDVPTQTRCCCPCCAMAAGSSITRRLKWRRCRQTLRREGQGGRYGPVPG